MYTHAQETIKDLTGASLTDPEIQKISNAISADHAAARQAINGSITIEQIVCKHLGVNHTEAFNPNIRSRFRHLVDARNLTAYFYTEYFNRGTNRGMWLSLADIGNIINRDHATVLHGARTAQNLMDTDKWFAAVADRIRIEINQNLDAETLSVYKQNTRITIINPSHEIAQ